MTAWGGIASSRPTVSCTLLSIYWLIIAVV